jgi:hypothetical protein
MPVTPETANYLFLGIAVVVIIMLVLVGSMVIRQRNLQRDAEVIAELEKQQ